MEEIKEQIESIFKIKIDSNEEKTEKETVEEILNINLGDEE